MFNHITEIPSVLTRVLCHAYKEFGLSDFTLYSWQQIWSDTSLGFGGVAGQAISRAQTFVLESKTEAHVYHGGQYAYTCKTDDARYEQWMTDKQFPGAVEFGRGDTCGWFDASDPIEDGEAECCDQQAKYTTCMGYNACIDHRCRCSKPLRSGDVG